MKRTHSYRTCARALSMYIYLHTSTDIYIYLGLYLYAHLRINTHIHTYSPHPHTFPRSQHQCLFLRQSTQAHLSLAGCLARRGDLCRRACQRVNAQEHSDSYVEYPNRAVSWRTTSKLWWKRLRVERRWER